MTKTSQEFSLKEHSVRKIIIDNNVGRGLFNDLKKLGFEVDYLQKMDRKDFAKFLTATKDSILVTECRELALMCRKRGIMAIRMNPITTFVGLEEDRPRTLRVLNKLDDELFRLWILAKTDFNYIINWTESMENLTEHCNRMFARMNQH